MKVMIIGSGGREHALAWKIAENPKVSRIYCAPGNGGTALEHKCENIDITDIKALISFAKAESIDLTIVGPEEPLTNGIVDEFKKENLNIFGPDKRAAMLEGSKIFSKNFMKKYGVKTAEYECFKDVKEALNYINFCEYPVVIKADGLAAGKGVVICSTREEAVKAIEDFMISDIFKGAGLEIVIEEYLEGVEASILSITDGSTILPFLSAKDHKQIYENDMGPNTGGMGVIAPNPYVDDEVMKSFNEDILLPTLRGIQSEGMDYKGIIFFGIMICRKGVYLLEYNVRMGDPETQAVLSLMESDFLELMLSSLSESLHDTEIRWKQGSCCAIVAASGGYPAFYEKGYPIRIKENIPGKVFAAGVNLNNGILETSGGRVLCVTACGNDLTSAIEKAYEAVEFIDFKNMYYRKDIGKISENCEKAFKEQESYELV